MTNSAERIKYKCRSPLAKRARSAKSRCSDRVRCIWRTRIGVQQPVVRLRWCIHNEATRRVLCHMKPFWLRNRCTCVHGLKMVVWLFDSLRGRTAQSGAVRTDALSDPGTIGMDGVSALVGGLEYVVLIKGQASQNCTPRAKHGFPCAALGQGHDLCVG